MNLEPTISCLDRARLRSDLRLGQVISCKWRAIRQESEFARGSPVDSDVDVLRSTIVVGQLDIVSAVV